MHPGLSNLENCMAAVRDCDVFLDIIRPVYGSGKIGPRAIMHEECCEAVRLQKPRWFLVHRDVTFARQLLKPYIYRKDGTRTRFRLKRNPVLDDLRVIDLYNDVIQNETLLVIEGGIGRRNITTWTRPFVTSILNSKMYVKCAVSARGCNNHDGQ